MQALDLHLTQLHAIEDAKAKYFDPLAIIQDMKDICFTNISDDQLG